ncbi:unnamed protein product [Ectocarpus sp. CCAP 1310/34]|nr:unnamed protein product [Ectocarpus sp. CCAP 1310/34]
MYIHVLLSASRPLSSYRLNNSAYEFRNFLLPPNHQDRPQIEQNPVPQFGAGTWGEIGLLRLVSWGIKLFT